jgi:HAD superfamily hydrolase (TIGR01509 family)
MLYTAALLDIDGTLIDSNDAHAQAWVQALETFGRRVQFARVRPLIGMGGDKVLPELTGIDAESDEGQAISARRSEIFRRDFVPRLQPTRGAKRLVAFLRDEGLRIVVATSAKADEVTELLRVAGAEDLIDASSSSDDADRSKPDPDIVRAALRRGRSAASESIMIGDTPYDIEAAARAGLPAIALRCGGWWGDDALAGAAAIYDDPEDLLTRFDRSPFRRTLPARSA